MEKLIISQNHIVVHKYLSEFDVQIAVKREDLIHPHISGNKYRKLKYNLLEAKKYKVETLLAFGGAFSNHIVATAKAGNESGFKTIGVIRGEELVEKVDKNHSLVFAKANNMQLHFVSRERYKQKNCADFIAELKEKFGNFYLLPEGGTNKLAVKGCEEILTPEDDEFDVICAPVGTGGTLAGIINSSQTHQKVIGFSALKGDFLKTEVEKWTTKTNWFITDKYCFGGYAKINQLLIDFINQFKFETGIPLDPIYTGKMMYGIFRMIEEGKIPKKSRILAIHTGGLQGITGMNEKLKSQNRPLIDV